MASRVAATPDFIDVDESLRELAGHDFASLDIPSLTRVADIPIPFYEIEGDRSPEEPNATHGMYRTRSRQRSSSLDNTSISSDGVQESVVYPARKKTRQEQQDVEEDRKWLSTYADDVGTPTASLPALLSMCDVSGQSIYFFRDLCTVQLINNG